MPQYRQLVFDSSLAVLAQRLMGSRSVLLHRDHLLVKEPGTRQRTAWRQNQPYYNIEGRQSISMWIPVDPVSRPATLEFVAGSHKGPWLMPRSFLSIEVRWFAEGSLQGLPDIEAAGARHPILGWEIEVGDFVCFHMLTLHAAGGVESTRRRRVFSLRFLGDDITHAPRHWVTSPPFDGLERAVPAGAPMDNPLFPLLIGGSLRCRRCTARFIACVPAWHTGVRHQRCRHVTFDLPRTGAAGSPGADDKI